MRSRSSEYNTCRASTHNTVLNNYVTEDKHRVEVGQGSCSLAPAGPAHNTEQWDYSGIIMGLWAGTASGSSQHTVLIDAPL